MSIFTNIGDGCKALMLAKEIKGGGMDIKTVAGWIKIIGYLFAGIALIQSYVDPKTVLAFTIALSALVKIGEIIAPLTKTTADDEIVKTLKDEGNEHGLLK